MYTVVMAALMLLAAGRVGAESSAPAEAVADVSAPEQRRLLQRRSLIDSEIETELQAQRQYRIVPPAVVASLGALPALGGLITLALGGLIALVMPDDGPGGPRPIDLPWVRNSLYPVGVGTAVAAGGLGWLFSRLKHRRVHTKRILQLRREREHLTTSPTVAREPRSAAEVGIVPLLSVRAGGALLSLRF
jgi:hypothetical protein